jgi:hypothetical protein
VGGREGGRTELIIRGERSARAVKVTAIFIMPLGF